MRRVNTGPGPTELPARNQGGIAPSPSPSAPRGPMGTHTQARTKPGTVAPVVPSAPIPRSRQDTIQRPITSPSTARPLPPPPPGSAMPGQPQPASVSITATEAAPAAPGLQPQGEAGAGLQMQDAQQVAHGQAPASPLDMEAQSRAIEDQRLAQPSAIPGVPVGTYESVAKKAAPPPGFSEIKTKRWNEDRDKQLSEFGDWPGKGDPKAPPPPIRPFGRSFNPFTGKFTGEKGPNAFALMGVDMEKLKSEFFRNGGK